MTTPMTVSDLRTKRADVWEKAKAFLDERRDTTTGCLSAEDDQAYAKMEAEIDRLTNEIARSERALRRDADLARATNMPLTSMPGMNPMMKPSRLHRARPPRISGRFGTRCGSTFLRWKSATHCLKASILRAAIWCLMSSNVP